MEGATGKVGVCSRAAQSGKLRKAFERIPGCCVETAGAGRRRPGAERRTRREEEAQGRGGPGEATAVIQLADAAGSRHRSSEWETHAGVGWGSTYRTLGAQRAARQSLSPGFRPVELHGWGGNASRGPDLGNKHKVCPRHVGRQRALSHPGDGGSAAGCPEPSV